MHIPIKRTVERIPGGIMIGCSVSCSASAW
jgi:hypothetical protein